MSNELALASRSPTKKQVVVSKKKVAKTYAGTPASATRKRAPTLVSPDNCSPHLKGGYLFACSYERLQLEQKSRHLNLDDYAPPQHYSEAVLGKPSSPCQSKARTQGRCNSRCSLRAHSVHVRFHLNHKPDLLPTQLPSERFFIFHK